MQLGGYQLDALACTEISNAIILSEQSAHDATCAELEMMLKDRDAV
jgi:hypothetical protein